MKSAIPTLICGLALTHTLSAQSLVNSSTDSGVFGPNANVTVDLPPLGGPVPKTGTLNTHWTATSTGGLSLSILSGTAAQVALKDNTLQFNNQNTGILGALGVGVTIGESWSATGKFSDLTMAAGQTYRVSFFVDGSNGLLNSTLSIAPNFSMELLDGGGNAITSVSSGNLINIAGLLGTGVPSGTVTVDFVAPVGVNTNPGSIRFNGAATLNATALGLGTNFATISNLNISAVPEPSALLLGAFGALGLLRRRRN